MPTDRRARQAAQTRTEILDAALTCFARRGYRATTVAEIARVAGVSVQTIYDSVGSKAALVRELNDLIDERAAIAEVAGPAFHEADPAAVLAVPGRITRRIIETSGDIVRVLASGAEVEAELRIVLDEGMRRHRDGAAAIAGRLAALGALADGLAVADAADTISVQTETATWLLLHDHYGWDLDRVERWTIQNLAALVLAPRDAQG
jgi:AcrR family transcriptional regulator